MEINQKYNLLQGQSFFSQLEKNEKRSISQFAELRKIKKNNDFYFSSIENDKIYFIAKGLVKLMTNDDGNESIKEILNENDIFGYIFSENNYKKEDEFIRVISNEVFILSFNVIDFENILKRNPTLALMYTRKVGEKLKSIENRFSDLIHKNTKARLISFLRDFAVKNGKKENNKVTSNCFLTQQDIAGLIGASRQTVTTMMKELEAYNQVNYTRSTLTFYF